MFCYRGPAENLAGLKKKRYISSPTPLSKDMLVIPCSYLHLHNNLSWWGSGILNADPVSSNGSREANWIHRRALQWPVAQQHSLWKFRTLEIIDLPGEKWHVTAGFPRTGQNTAWLWAVTSTGDPEQRERGGFQRSKKGRGEVTKIHPEVRTRSMNVLRTQQLFSKKWMCGRISNPGPSFNYIYEPENGK